MLRPQNSSGTIATTTHIAFQTSFKQANRDPEDWVDRMSIPKGETVTALQNPSAVKQGSMGHSGQGPWF